MVWYGVWYGMKYLVWNIQYENMQCGSVMYMYAVWYGTYVRTYGICSMVWYGICSMVWYGVCSMVWYGISGMEYTV